MKSKTYAGMGSRFSSARRLLFPEPGRDPRPHRRALSFFGQRIVAARKLMEKAISDIREGREPPHVVRTASEDRFPHLLALSDMIPNDDWKGYTKNLEAEARAKI